MKINEMHLKYTAKFPAVLALLCAALPCGASIIAADNYSSYTAGTIAGQTVGGTGFTGTWARTPGLGQNLTADGSSHIGRPTVTAGNAGDFENFSSTLSVTVGALFINSRSIPPRP